MSARSETSYGEVLAAAPPVLAEAAIRHIDGMLSNGAERDEVQEVAGTAVALLKLHQQGRARPGRRQPWLAKVTSFAFPRTFARAWGDTGEHYVCFTAEITKGSKQALGRQVELQVPLEDAERLGQQLLRMVAVQRRQTAATDFPHHDAGHQKEPTEGDRVT